MSSLPLYSKADLEKIGQEVRNGSNFFELANYFDLTNRVYKQMGIYLELNVNGKFGISSDRDIAELFGTEESIVKRYLEDRLDKDGLVRRGEILKKSRKLSKQLA